MASQFSITKQSIILREYILEKKTKTNLRAVTSEILCNFHSRLINATIKESRTLYFWAHAVWLQQPVIVRRVKMLDYGIHYCRKRNL